MSTASQLKPILESVKHVFSVMAFCAYVDAVQYVCVLA